MAMPPKYLTASLAEALYGTQDVAEFHRATEAPPIAPPEDFYDPDRSIESILAEVILTDGVDALVDAVALIKTIRALRFAEPGAKDWWDGVIARVVETMPPELRDQVMQRLMQNPTAGSAAMQVALDAEMGTVTR